MKLFLLPTDLRKVALLSAICFLGVTFHSCEKEGSINPSFESNSSGAFFTDSVEIHVKTVKEDSISTGQSSLSLFGQYKDSIFGKSEASFYTQVLLPFNGVNVATAGNFTIDSVVLSLVYAGKYGEEATQTINVYQLTEDLKKAKKYFSNDSVSVDDLNPLAQQQFTSNIEAKMKIAVPNDQGSVDTVEVLPQLRIKLDPSIGQSILEQTPSGALANNEAFTKFFKGIYVAPSSSSTPVFGQNNILYFALTNSQSKVSIFFTETSTQKKKILNLPISKEAVRFNRYSHDFSNTPVQQALLDGNDSLRTFALSMAGVRPVLTFPHITKTFPADKHYVLNKAEIILPVETGDYFSLGRPDQLLALTSDSTGRLIFTEDITNSSTAGRYNAADTTYRFNITRYLDGIINDAKLDRGLTFIPNGSAINAQRLILKGPESQKKMKLKLYYSKLD